MDDATVRAQPPVDGTGVGWIVASRWSDDSGPLWATLRAVLGSSQADESGGDAESRHAAARIAIHEPELDEAVSEAADGGAISVIVLPVAVLVDRGTSRDVGPDIEGRLDQLRATYPDLDIHSVGRPGDGGVLAARVIELLRAEQPSPADTVDATLARVFDSRTDVLAGFLEALHEGLAQGTALYMRGSAVSGRSFETGAPFDARGPGSSDLDMVAIGDEAAASWVPEARLLGGLNSLPLCDGSEWVAPALDPARRRAQAIVGRPVSLQSMAKWFLDLRAAMQGQPYIDLGPPEP